MSQYEFIDKRVPLALDNPSIYHDISKCKNCTLCRRACADVMSVLDYYDLDANGDVPVCIHCGQCAAACPFDSMHAKSELEKVKAALADPEKIVVIQTAPAVRVAIGEGFGYEPGTFLEGKMVGALRALGADYVVDTNFGADLTIMEEATEFLERFQSGSLNNRPMFTSCCPGWLRFVKTQFPEMVSQLSTAKSPQQMFGAVMKTYFAQSIGVDPENIVTVSVMPCVAKKAEADMDFYYKEYAGKDVDIVLTTREFTRMLRETHIRPEVLTDRKPDSLMQEWTGAGVIFGEGTSF